MHDKDYKFNENNYDVLRLLFFFNYCILFLDILFFKEWSNYSKKNLKQLFHYSYSSFSFIIIPLVLIYEKKNYTSLRYKQILVTFILLKYSNFILCRTFVTLS